MRVSVFLVTLVMILLLTPSCSSIPTNPGIFGRTFVTLDAEVGDDEVLLRWGSRFWPPVDWPDEPVEQPARVRLEISEEGPYSGYRLLAWREGGIASDSLSVGPLERGRAYWFRVAFFPKSNLPMLISAPTAVVTGALVPSRIFALEGPASYSGLDWSPDGTRLLTVRLSSYAGAAATLDPATGAANLLPPPPGGTEYLRDAAYSPSGRWITYFSTPSLTGYLLDYRVWVATFTGDSAFATTDGGVSAPAWGRDDSTLVFLRDDQFYIANPWGTEQAQQLTFGLTHVRGQPSIRPGDGSIAFVVQARDYPDTGIYHVALGGGTAAPLTVDGVSNSDSPKWSPDGTRLLFVSGRAGHGDIWILDFATGRLRQLTTGRRFLREAVSADWSPDGGEIAVLERFGWEWRVAFYPLSGLNS